MLLFFILVLAGIATWIVPAGSTNTTTPPKKRSEGLNPYVLLFFILVLAGIWPTWIVPAGQ
ncbi:hypothetical protein PR729_23955 [Providencia rettgeri]|nr:hypothetical protein PR729_23955 [Providencia rettgeri]